MDEEKLDTIFYICFNERVEIAPIFDRIYSSYKIFNSIDVNIDDSVDIILIFDIHQTEAKRIAYLLDKYKVI